MIHCYKGFQNTYTADQNGVNAIRTQPKHVNRHLLQAIY